MACMLMVISLLYVVRHKAKLSLPPHTSPPPFISGGSRS